MVSISAVKVNVDEGMHIYHTHVTHGYLEPMMNKLQYQSPLQHITEFNSECKYTVEQ